MGKHTIKYLKKYNWEEIQNYHNDGNNWRKIIEKFKISSQGLSYAKSVGVFISRDKSVSGALAHKISPKKHSVETKKKISESRIKYLKDNPDKVPYLLNHSSNESYPEKYFSELFEKENLNIKRYLQIGLYELDFYILDKKIDIEIDGEQHYTDKKIVESDIRRTKFLTDNGWKIFRIRWADYQRLHYTEKEKYIKEILNKIASYP